MLVRCLSIIVALFLALSLVDCQKTTTEAGKATPTNNQQVAPGPTQDTTTEGAPSATLEQQTKDLVETTNAKLTELDKKIAELDEKAGAAADVAKAELTQQVARLREKRLAIAQDLDKLGQAAEAQWTELEAKVSGDVSALEREINGLVVKGDKY